MKNSIDIEEIYLTLRMHHLCSSGYDFSVRFLGKSKSYYSVLQVRGAQPSVEAISTMEKEINKLVRYISYSQIKSVKAMNTTLLNLSEQLSHYRQAQLKVL